MFLNECEDMNEPHRNERGRKDYSVQRPRASEGRTLFHARFRTRYIAVELAIVGVG